MLGFLCNPGGAARASPSAPKGGPRSQVAPPPLSPTDRFFLRQESSRQCIFSFVEDFVTVFLLNTVVLQEAMLPPHNAVQQAVLRILNVTL